MITEHPGLARLTYRRLRSASGAADLDDIEQRLETLAEAVGENHDLVGPLADLVARVESSVVPALERRHPAAAGGEVPPDPLPDNGGRGTVKLGIAEDPTDQ